MCKCIGLRLCHGRTFGRSCPFTWRNVAPGWHRIRLTRLTRSSGTMVAVDCSGCGALAVVAGGVCGGGWGGSFRGILDGCRCSSDCCGSCCSCFGATVSILLSRPRPPYEAKGLVMVVRPSVRGEMLRPTFGEIILSCCLLTIFLVRFLRLGLVHRTIFHELPFLQTRFLPGVFLLGLSFLCYFPSLFNGPHTSVVLMVVVRYPSHRHVNCPPCR
mmetsp:Transcript_8705/g.16916  ORF Transcript_8705/g.16916 Transcript_8705/m.16916 type:complete len:215 (+) Transcript_8705:2502-3146(+)